MPLYGLIADSPLLYGVQRLGSKATRGVSRSGSIVHRGPSSVSFKYKYKDLVLYPSFYEYINGMNGAVGRYMNRMTKQMELRAKHQVGVRTGALKRSIHTRHTIGPRGHTYWIGSELKYALLHHEGSRPHIITPSRAPELVFMRRGRVVHTKVVHHPGTKPNRYLSDQIRVNYLR
jgi:hypothetical protein